MVLEKRIQSGGCGCGGCGHSLTQPNSLSLSVRGGGGGGRGRGRSRGRGRRSFQIRCSKCGTSILKRQMDRIRKVVKSTLRQRNGGGRGGCKKSRRHGQLQRGGFGLSFPDAMRGLFGGVGPNTVGASAIITGKPPATDIVTNPPSLSTNRIPMA